MPYPPLFSQHDQIYSVKNHPVVDTHIFVIWAIATLTMNSAKFSKSHQNLFFSKDD